MPVWLDCAPQPASLGCSFLGPTPAPGLTCRSGDFSWLGGGMRMRARGTEGHAQPSPATPQKDSPPSSRPTRQGPPMHAPPTLPPGRADAKRSAPRRFPTRAATRPHMPSPSLPLGDWRAAEGWLKQALALSHACRGSPVLLGARARASFGPAPGFLGPPRAGSPCGDVGGSTRVLPCSVHTPPLSGALAQQQRRRRPWTGRAASLLVTRLLP